MTNTGLKAIGLLALTALAGCGPEEDDRPIDGSLAACFASYPQSCLVDAALAIYQTCYDGSGKCTWSESRGDNSYHLLLEWENGARYEVWISGTTSMAAIQAASGERCAVESIDRPDCRGGRISSSERWYEYCTDYDEGRTKVIGSRYTCDNGEQLSFTLDMQQGNSSISPMCSMEIFERYDCVDAQGRHFLDGSNSTSMPTPVRDPMCQGASCGDIGGRCTGAMSCDPGLSCQSTNVDPSVVYGFCTGPCDDANPCPAGLTCTNVFHPPTDTFRMQCMRPCSDAADCAPFGSRCDPQVHYCF